MVRILDSRIETAELRRLCDEYFHSLVKFVADMDNRILAVGGELHSDGEVRLLERGSSQHNLWGGNFYPDNPAEERIEYTALINIRPRDNNPQMEIQSESIRRQVRELVEKLFLAPDETLD